MKNEARGISRYEVVANLDGLERGLKINLEGLKKRQKNFNPFCDVFGLLVFNIHLKSSGI